MVLPPITTLELAVHRDGPVQELTQCTVEEGHDKNPMLAGMREYMREAG